MLKVNGVNFYLSQIEAILIVIETVKDKDEMTIIVEKVRNLSQEEMDRLKLELYDFLGFHSNI
jgi:phenylacetate-CoA ligase